ncbi:hypothetical protein Scep_029875 [Stephania cephalantha]|uniref:Uncharacterized protein n=1 Tax=Stephania cephalantha TaxID=152367 RepID=A0AAP0DYH8_9MAGN
MDRPRMRVLQPAERRGSRATAGEDGCGGAAGESWLLAKRLRRDEAMGVVDRMNTRRWRCCVVGRSILDEGCVDEIRRRDGGYVDDDNSRRILSTLGE